jgi:ABC-2 type transport system ATP-binding protein
MIFTTHDMREAEELFDRIALMHRGQLEVVGSAAELKARLYPGATLDDVFAHFTGVEIEPGGGFREIRQARRSERQHA